MTRLACDLEDYLGMALHWSIPTAPETQRPRGRSRRDQAARARQDDGESVRNLHQDDARAWEIEPVGDSCRLTVTHDQLREDANAQLYGGWPMILSGGKATTKPDSIG
jgi:hypothetical protein